MSERDANVTKVSARLTCRNDSISSLFIQNIFEVVCFPNLFLSDRYVIVGNHRDAWGFGAIDPSSGTASMMEVSAGFGAMKEKRGTF